MYSYKDLVWAKSVTRDKGLDWAYMECKAGDSIFLNWSSQWKGNILKAKPGEIILLFQTVKTHADRNKNGTYLTHLVTPIDKILREDKSNPNYPYGRFVGVISKPEKPKLKPIELSFLQPNRGAACSIDKIKVREKFGVDISFNAKQKMLWKFFPNSDFSIDSIYNALPAIFDEERDDISASEGELKYRFALHKYYERNPELVNAAKNKARREDRFFCEVCTFDFNKVYPGLGTGFIECHHRNPIASGGIRESKVGDLALVCSNCHRMLHKKFENSFLTAQELKSRFFK
jgi:hypothetical protein